MNTYLRYSLLLATAVSCGGFVFGFDASVISGAIGLVATEFGLGAWEQGIIVSAPTLGATLAALFAGRMADRIGRKRVLIITAWLYLVAGVWSCLSTSFATLALARFIGGIAFASLILAPMYIAEISPAKHRGKFVSINQLNIMLGFSAAYFVNYLILDAARSGAGAFARQCHRGAATAGTRVHGSGHADQGRRIDPLSRRYRTSAQSADRPGLFSSVGGDRRRLAECA